jgi:hypothetical protein
MQQMEAFNHRLDSNRDVILSIQRTVRDLQDDVHKLRYDVWKLNERA